MEERGRQFGRVAEAYDRFRFGYPAAVVDHVLAYAESPVRTALEIGAGTGKATRLFAARGVAVTATEPDPDMLAVLAASCRDVDVRPVVGTFEDLPPQPAVDLVYAAESLHWTVDEGRWDRVAALVRSGGTFASFAAPPELVDPALRAAEQESSDRFVRRSWQTDREPEPGALAWPGNELVADPRFIDVAEQRLPRRLTLKGGDYAAFLGTTSPYLALAPDRRTEALDDLRRRLPSEVAVDADVILHLARRR